MCSRYGGSRRLPILPKRRRSIGANCTKEIGARLGSFELRDAVIPAGPRRTRYSRTSLQIDPRKCAEGDDHHPNADIEPERLASHEAAVKQVCSLEDPN